MTDINNEVRCEVINDLLEELERFGHYQAVTQVEGCLNRLTARMDENQPRLVELSEPVSREA